MNVKNVVAVAGRGVEVVGVGSGEPFLFSGHWIYKITRSQELHLLSVDELDAFDQLLEVLRIFSLCKVRRIFDLSGAAKFGVSVDGIRNPSKPRFQFHLLLTSEAEFRHWDHHGRENPKDGDYGNQLGHGESELKSLQTCQASTAAGSFR